jgi:hypothetical protein
MPEKDELQRITDDLIGIQEKLQRLRNLDIVKDYLYWVRQKEICVERIRELSPDSCPFCAGRDEHDEECLLYR